MTPYLSIAVEESSQVGEARRQAVRLAADAGFDEDFCGRLALVVTELANNLARHAQRGQLLVGRRADLPAPSIEVLSLDHGPGMSDVAACLRDGYSTGGTPGTGLGAVQRQAQVFSVYSKPGDGTVVLARLDPAAARGPAADATPRVEVAGICVAAPGESVSGDAWQWCERGPRAAVMVVDGLGHGPLAAEAAAAAIAVFERSSGEPSQVLQQAHEALRGTRGAAGAVVLLDIDAGTVSFAGAGNIAGRLISGIDDRSLMSQHGTLGLQIRRLNDVAYAWPPHACLILHSDGIVSRWSLADAPGLLQCDPAVVAGWLLRDHCRGRDDATVVVLRRA